MGRAPCCDKANVKKGPWSPEEDSKLKEYIQKYGTGGNWIALPQKAGLKRCGKSCRLRWLNYLRPNIKHGEFSDEEDRVICALFASIGSRWSIIAAQLPGRTDNDIKNYWNTKLKKKFFMGMHPQAERPFQSSQQTTPFQTNQPLLSSLNKECSSYYTSTTKSFSGLDPGISIPLSFLSSSTLATHPSAFQTQEISRANFVQYDPVKENLLMFGSEGSCSSSDGSCTRISNGREIKQEVMAFQGYISDGLEEKQKFMLNYGSILMFGSERSCSSSDGSCTRISNGREIKQEVVAFQGYISDGLEENQKFMLNYGSNGGENVNQWAEKPHAYFGDQVPLEYLEDIKQLVVSSNNGANNLVNVDEIKTAEKARTSTEKLTSDCK